MPNKRGVDTLLTSQGKSLQVGQEVRFTLIKGPNNTFDWRPDPINPKAPKEQFPLVAKFSESVVTPHLNKNPWNTARLYQRDAPKAEEDSDDEDQNGNTPKPNPAKKRWRRRKDAPKRQWVLQEQVEFLETMMAKRQKKQMARGQISSFYKGIPEHNPSQYVLLETSSTEPNSHTISVTTLPTPNAMIAFSQPKARKTLSMTEAEQAIEDQRGKMTRYMMHDKKRALLAAGGLGSASAGNMNNGNLESRKRLFGKLTKKRKNPDGGDEEVEDDIMGDLAFRNRKGSGRARKELLNSLGDSALKVDADGVLGGGNDAEFGRGQRFGRFKAEQPGQQDGANVKGGEAGGGKGGAPEASSRGNDGSAMADDFYQRDVQAEYEELDYDANEQFDDDDVDVGETEVVVEGGGYADDEEEEDLDDDDLMMGDKPSGAEGLASLTGFKLMLAKARGEITNEQISEQAEGQKAKEDLFQKRAAEAALKRNQEEGGGAPDHLAQIMAADQKSREEANLKNNPLQPGGEAKNSSSPKNKILSKEPSGIQVDDNGQRIITLDAVRREIWLHHGTIPMKRVMKIFDIKKKSAQDRQNKFREAVKELCTMETDPIGGRMLVLKQHYANMG